MSLSLRKLWQRSVAVGQFRPDLRPIIGAQFAARRNTSLFGERSKSDQFVVWYA
jgi:hypothetical protein